MSGTETHFIQATGLTYSTPGGRCLQRGLEFGLTRGQLLLVQGDNGTGKSTLLKVLLGHWRADRGEIRVAPGTRVEFLPQMENLEVHLPLTLGDVLWMGTGHTEEDQVEQWGLLSAESLDRSWNTASGGERKRALLTRALLANPDLLVLDEPMNHLDPDSRLAMLQSLQRFLGRGGAAILVCHRGLESGERGQFSCQDLVLEVPRG